MLFRLFVAFFILFASLFLGSVTFATPQEISERLKLNGSRERVTHVIDATTLALQGGRIVSLSEIIVPPGQEATLKSARDWLRDTLLNQDVMIYVTRDDDTGRRNRFDFELAHIVDGQGLWIQGAMVQAGLALTYPVEGNNHMRNELLTLEAQAREKKLGLWEDTLSILQADKQHDIPTGSFQIVEGDVYSASSRNNIIYLNFTNNWREDFTARIKKESRMSFSSSGMNPLSLNGKTIRVRGYVESYNGPMITLTHPGQVEIIPDQ